MRGENGKESLMVCLSEYQILRTVYILVIKGCFAKRPRIAMFDFKIMSFRPTYCPRGKRRSNHEINGYVFRAC